MPNSGSRHPRRAPARTQTGLPGQFSAALRALAKPGEVPKVARFFHPDPNAGSPGNQVLGVPIGKVFPVAKRFASMRLLRFLDEHGRSMPRPMLRHAVEKLPSAARLNYLQ